MWSKLNNQNEANDLKTDNQFSSNKPYLFRAILEWLLDNDSTPYILVDASHPDVKVPNEHVKDQQIVLNISPAAIQHWHVDNFSLSFSARFSGRVRQIYVPMDALMAIYAQENGLGMAFPAQQNFDFDESGGAGEDDLFNGDADKLVSATSEKNNLSAVDGEEKQSASSKKKSHLKLIK